MGVLWPSITRSCHLRIANPSTSGGSPSGTPDGLKKYVAWLGMVKSGFDTELCIEKNEVREE
jgi:hypothetical protein